MLIAYIGKIPYSHIEPLVAIAIIVGVIGVVDIIGIIGIVIVIVVPLWTVDNNVIGLITNIAASWSIIIIPIIVIVVELIPVVIIIRVVVSIPVSTVTC